MNGLIKNNFYGVLGNMKIVSAFLLLLGTLQVVTGEATILSIFTLMAAPIISILAISSMRKEGASKWTKYKLTLPVRRRHIVKSQYVSHLLCSSAGVVFATIFMALTVLIHGNIYFYYGFRDAVTLVLGGWVLSALIGEIAYPLYYLWGEEKTEVILVLSVIGAICIIFGISLGINFLTGNEGVSDAVYYISLILILIITAIAEICFYVFAVRIFESKEY